MTGGRPPSGPERAAVTCAGQSDDGPSRTGILLTALLCTAVALGFVFLQLPGKTRFWHALQNSGHGLAFALLTLAALRSVGDRGAARRQVLALLALFCLGLAIELGQHLSGRGASLHDVAMNLSGIAGGALLAAALARPAARRHGAPRPGDGRSRRILCATLAVLALMWCLRWPATLLVVRLGAPDLPVLEDFERIGVTTRLTTNATRVERLRHASAWPANAGAVLRVRFEAGRWPGFGLLEPWADWRAFESLRFRVFNPSDEMLALYVRIDDHATGSEVRHVVTAALAPEENLVEIALGTLRTGSVEPPLANPSAEDSASNVALADVRQVIVHLSANARERTLLFDDFVLD